MGGRRSRARGRVPEHPLTSLSRMLARGTRVPLAWTVQHAPSGSLEPLWTRCDDPRPLLRVAACLATREQLVDVAAEFADSVAYLVAADDREDAHRALVALRSWRRGGTTSAQLAALLPTLRTEYRDFATHSAFESVRAAVATAVAPVPAEPALQVAEHVISALRWQRSKLDPNAVFTAPTRAEQDLSDRVRRRFACPDLATLLAPPPRPPAT